MMAPEEAIAEQRTHGPGNGQAAYDAIVGLTDAFCREHLNAEYEACAANWPGSWPASGPRHCPAASRRPGPAPSCRTSAGSTSWTTQPATDIKLTAIDKAFGVAQAPARANRRRSATCSRSASSIPLDAAQPHGRHLDDLDAGRQRRHHRHPQVPEEAQVIAFQKGLIPYIPADRGEKD